MELPQLQHRHHRKQNNLHKQKSHAAAQPTEHMFCALRRETRQILLFLLTRGYDCFVPTDFGYDFFKGACKQWKIFSR